MFLKRGDLKPFALGVAEMIPKTHSAQFLMLLKDKISFGGIHKNTQQSEIVS